MSTITVTGLKWVPPFARGLVRDLRVRWALEEAGLGYVDRPISREDRQSQEHLARQPFGQVPVFEQDGLVLFESGSIVLHIAEQSDALLPTEPAARARAIGWVFAALNTIEPRVQGLAEIDLFAVNEEWARLRRPDVVQAVNKRLGELAVSLDSKDYLDGRFTAGDLMMTTVLRILRHTDLVANQPVLAAYQARCEARPAFERALAAQLASFDAEPG